ncbi:MAG: hypothetical protein LBV23_06580 [Deltaproteobacteria bacterium]|nr:hypothetical protein [Deltaproteobacteria bacterium]
MTDTSADKQPKSNAAKYVLTVIVILAILGVAGYFYFSSKGDQEAKETFKLLMDHVFGANKWSAASQNFNLATQTLTVKGLEIKVDKFDPTVTTPIKVETVEIVKGLNYAELKNFLALKDWRDQPNCHFFERFTLKNIDFTDKQDKLDGSIKISDLTLTDVALNKADASNSAGVFGFLKKSHIGKLDISDASLVIKETGTDYNLTLGWRKVENKDLGFSPEIASVTSPNDILGILTSLSIGQVQINDFYTSFNDNKKSNINYKIEEFTQTGLQNLTVNQILSKNMLFDGFFDNKFKVNISIENQIINKIDFKYLFNRFVKIVQEIINKKLESGSSESFDSLYDVYAENYYLADGFISPIGLDDFNLSNLKLTVNEDAVVTMAKFSFQGPVEAGKIAPQSQAILQDFTLDFPAARKEEPTEEFFKVLKDFGQTSFTINYTFNSSYDLNSGLLMAEANPGLAVTDLIDYNASFKLGNLTPQLISELSKIKLKEPQQLLLSPEFQKLELIHFRLEFINRSLVEKLLAYYAKKADKPIGEYQTEVANYTQILVAMQLSSKVENFDDYAKALSNFITKPQKLVIDISPKSAFNYVSATSSNSATKIVDLLNASLSVNDQAPIVLKLKEKNSDSEILEDNDSLDDLS